MQNIKKSFFVLVDTFVVFFSADCESVCQFCAHWPLWSEFPRIMSPLNKKKIDPLNSIQHLSCTDEKSVLVIVGLFACICTRTCSIVH